MHYLGKISRTYGAPPTYAVCFDPATIIGAITGAISIGSSLFGGSKKSSSPAAVAEAPPPIQEPAVLPDPDDKALKNEKRRRAAQRRQRSGRLSTINTEPQDTVLG